MYINYCIWQNFGGGKLTYLQGKTLKLCSWPCHVNRKEISVYICMLDNFCTWNEEALKFSPSNIFILTNQLMYITIYTYTASAPAKLYVK